jgi:hypothetical protein
MLYCIWSAGPCLPCVILILSVFCAHLVIYQQLQLGYSQKLATEQLLDRTGSTIRHGRRYGPPFTVQNTLSPTASKYRKDLFLFFSTFFISIFEFHLKLNHITAASKINPPALYCFVPFRKLIL